MDLHIRDLKPIFSHEDTIYDYYISMDRGDLTNFKNML